MPAPRRRAPAPIRRKRVDGMRTMTPWIVWRGAPVPPAPSVGRLSGAPGHPGAFARESCSGERDASRWGAPGVLADGDPGEGADRAHERPAATGPGCADPSRGRALRAAADPSHVHADP